MRPPLDKLPADCPAPLVAMVTACWDGDRRRRLSAVRCLHVIGEELMALEAAAEAAEAEAGDGDGDEPTPTAEAEVWQWRQELARARPCHRPVLSCGV